jgi:hypothetical protein
MVSPAEKRLRSLISDLCRATGPYRTIEAQREQSQAARIEPGKVRLRNRKYCGTASDEAWLFGNTEQLNGS